MNKISLENCYYHKNQQRKSICVRCNNEICNLCIKNIYFHENEYGDEEIFVEGMFKEKNMIHYENDFNTKNETKKICFPCYYYYTSNLLSESDTLFNKAINFIVEHLFVYAILIYIIFMAPPFAISMIESSLLAVGLIISYNILIYFIKNKFKNTEIITKEELEKQKRDYEITLPNMDFPKENLCKYCKEPIYEDQMDCMNVSCTMGEEIDELKETDINPVRSNLFTNSMKNKREIEDEFDSLK